MDGPGNFRYVFGLEMRFSMRCINWNSIERICQDLEK